MSEAIPPPVMDMSKDDFGVKEYIRTKDEFAGISGIEIAFVNPEDDNLIHSMMTFKSAKKLYQELNEIFGGRK